MSSEVQDASLSILHICTRELIRELRDSILRLEGYHVVSTLSLTEGGQLAAASQFDLILIDVEGDGRIPQAEKLCSDVREKSPDQKIAFVCNYRIGHLSDCPDEIIRSEFNPAAMIKGVNSILHGE